MELSIIPKATNNILHDDETTYYSRRETFVKSSSSKNNTILVTSTPGPPTNMTENSPETEMYNVKKPSPKMTTIMSNTTTTTQ